MKKQVILIAMVVTFGTTNLAMAWSFGLGTATLAEETSKSWKTGKTPSMPKKTSQKPIPPQPKKISLSEFLEVVKKQLEETKKIHQSITGNKKLSFKNPTEIQTNQNSFFLKDPELIYNEAARSDISASLENILNEENISTSIYESRNSIGKRIQYATVIDKAVSLQTFQETKNRFTQIEKLLNEIEKTKDLKDIAELQSHLIGTLALIQNETAKLYMVAHLRNAEQSLIRQQKNKHNIKILNSNNTKMPTIRFIR